MLQGKCVAFWFYEEQCPNCREFWPEIIEVAQKFAGQPVVFVAVNSGTDAASVAQYIKGVNLKWPVLVDSNRQFEAQWVRLWGGSQISLANVHQVAFLTKDGRQQSGRWYDVEGSVKKVLAGKIDPKTMPGPLVPTWKQIQAGQYAAALPGLQAGLTSQSAEVKGAAEFAADYAESKMREWAYHAKKARKDGKAWESYKLYASLARAFEGYNLPPEVTSAPSELLKDVQVRRQVDAQNALEAAKQSLTSVANEPQKKQAAEKLQAVVANFSGTEAASEAQRLLATADQ
jgi:thiol-disulfide isomerase/thioredoxin